MMILVSVRFCGRTRTFSFEWTQSLDLCLPFSIDCYEPLSLSLLGNMSIDVGCSFAGSTKFLAFSTGIPIGLILLMYRYFLKHFCLLSRKHPQVLHQKMKQNQGDAPKDAQLLGSECGRSSFGVILPEVSQGQTLSGQGHSGVL